MSNGHSLSELVFQRTLLGFMSPCMKPALFNAASVVANAHAERESASPERRWCCNVPAARSITIAG
eukprot:2882460-Amphidinium_carterae.1